MRRLEDTRSARTSAQAVQDATCARAASAVGRRGRRSRVARAATMVRSWAAWAAVVEGCASVMSKVRRRRLVRGSASSHPVRARCDAAQCEDRTAECRADPTETSTTGFGAVASPTTRWSLAGVPDGSVRGHDSRPMAARCAPADSTEWHAGQEQSDKTQAVKPTPMGRVTASRGEPIAPSRRRQGLGRSRSTSPGVSRRSRGRRGVQARTERRSEREEVAVQRPAGRAGARRVDGIIAAAEASATANRSWRACDVRRQPRNSSMRSDEDVAQRQPAAVDPRLDRPERDARSSRRSRRSRSPRRRTGRSRSAGRR